MPEHFLKPDIIVRPKISSFDQIHGEIMKKRREAEWQRKKTHNLGRTR